MMNLTPAVKNIIILNVIVFVCTFLLAPAIPGMEELIIKYFSLWKSNLLGIHDPRLMAQIEAAGYGFVPIQLVTWFFTHGGIFHILFNMLWLATLGSAVEFVMGSRRFVEFYLFCGLVGGLMVAFLDPSPIRVVGASGAVFGVMVAFAIHYPRHKLHLFLLPPMEARTFVLGILAISGALVVVDLLQPDSGIGITGGLSHFGHLTGGLAGYLYFQLRKFIPNR
jgi:membrane associated rhomboid family serine protease